MLMTRRLQKYSNIDMFTPLVEQMVNNDPSQCPSASEALREWKTVRRQIYRIQRYWQLRPREEMWIATFFLECKATVCIYSSGWFLDLLINVAPYRFSPSSDPGNLDEHESYRPADPYPSWIVPICSLFSAITWFLDVQCSRLLSLLFVHVSHDVASTMDRTPAQRHSEC